MQKPFYKTEFFEGFQPVTAEAYDRYYQQSAIRAQAYLDDFKPYFDPHCPISFRSETEGNLIKFFLVIGDI